ncbi:MAG TPA: hypothetical protein VLE72_02190 [Candidatus Saccharimonadales bacterium]|nr:hypothetical protein [Candidatus Saccharimonadales bacterium]
MKKNLLGANTDIVPPNGFGFSDGFRFGFGFFVAWLLGLSILSGLGYLILKIFKII